MLFLTVRHRQELSYPRPPLLGLGFLIYRIYRLFRYGLSRQPGSEVLKIVNRALSRFAVASYLPSCNVPMRLEVLNAGGSLLSILSLSLIKYLIPTNLNRIINLYSLWGSCNGLS